MSIVLGSRPSAVHGNVKRAAVLALAFSVLQMNADRRDFELILLDGTSVTPRVLITLIRTNWELKLIIGSKSGS